MVNLAVRRTDRQGHTQDAPPPKKRCVCHVPARMPNVLASGETGISIWQQVPDSLLLQVFSFLDLPSLLTAAEVCKIWHRVTQDEFLWKDLFYSTWKIPNCVPMAPGKVSWLAEFQRLYLHTPLIESQVLREHRDQVLHVSFSHNGKMFATSSKDGFVKVWSAGNPASVIYYADMREFTWKYTQFSQFNESDSLLLVSGVHFGSHSTSGEIAVFSLGDGKFELQCRVLNKPYDIFGTWYNDSYLLSGNLHWLGHLTSCSGIWLNKASQALESEHESVVMRLYKFRNINASSIRTIMIANCTDDSNKTTGPGSQSSPDVPSDLGRKRKGSEEESAETSDTSHSECSQGKARKAGQKLSQKMQVFSDGAHGLKLLEVDEESGDVNSTIEYNANYRLAQSSVFDYHFDGMSKTESVPSFGVSTHESNAGNDSEGSQVTPLLPSPTLYPVNWNLPASQSDSCLQLGSDQCDSRQDIPNMFGSISESPQAGNQMPGDQAEIPDFLCAAPQADLLSLDQDCEPQTSATADSKDLLDSGTVVDKYLIFTTGMKTYTPHQIGIKRIKSLEAAHSTDLTTSSDGVRLLPSVEENDYGMNRPNEFDSVDHLIELHGHIIGMCLSPDHRYLYVNSRPWPQGYEIEDPLYPPPIAQEIDIHVIDLETMQEVGTMHRAHKAYTPNDECFFIFLDVCDEYVASGAEDRRGYLWDRHYGVCLTKFPHTDVVNSVAFNPKDPEMLITASDDNSLKIWRSRCRERQVKRHQFLSTKLVI